MSDQSGDVRYAPPQAQVADVASSFRASGQLATRWRRLGAYLIDVVIAVGILMLLDWFTPFGARAGRNDLGLWTPDWIAFAVECGIFLLLNGYLLTKHGQTLGKALLKIRIVRTNGNKVSAVRIIGLRYGLGMVSSAALLPALAYGVIDSLFIFRKSRRCLHDLIADTTVVNV